jgi:hypothetical protein
MNKYLIFLIPLFLWGCGNKNNEIIDTGITNYQVINVSHFSDFLYVPGDSSIVASISFNSSAEIKSVNANIIAPDGDILNASPIPLYDDGNDLLHGDVTKGDNTFSNKYPFSQSFLNGKYTIQYYILNSNDKSLLAAEHSFIYNNNITDVAPFVSNLVAPDTVSQLDTSIVAINVSIAVFDSNGAGDIQIVYFNSFLPDGTPSQQNPIIMYDDGDPNHGDATAGDGIYSTIVKLPSKSSIPLVPLGTFRWEFQAKDREKKTSNIIIHNIVIK